MTISIPVDFKVTSNLDDELDDAAAAGKKVANSIGSSISNDLDQASASAKKFRVSADGAASGADTLASGSSQAAGGLGDLGGALSLLPGPLGGLGAGMELAAPAIMGVTGAADLVNLALEKMKLATLASKIATAAQTAVQTVATVATNALAIATRGLGLAIRFATGPVGLILIGLTALVAGLIFAWKNSETFRNIVLGTFEAIKAAIPPILDFIVSVVKGTFTVIADVVGAVVSGIKATVEFAFQAIGDVIGFYVEAWKFIIKTGVALIRGYFNILGEVVEFVAGIWKAILNGVQTAFGAIKDLVTTRIDDVVNAILFLPKKIIGLYGQLIDAGKGLIEALFKGIGSAASGVGGFVADIAGKLKDAINNLLNLPLTVGPLKVLGKEVLGKVTLIPAFAAGTDFAPGGLALVGEQGPELVNLPRGSQVSTAAETRAALAPTEITVMLPTGDPMAAAMSVLNALAAAGR